MTKSSSARAELATESLRELEEQHKWYTEELRSVGRRVTRRSSASALLDEQLAEMQVPTLTRFARSGRASPPPSGPKAGRRRHSRRAAGAASAREAAATARLSARRRRPAWRRTVSTAPRPQG